jgi:hypothetical protein
MLPGLSPALQGALLCNGKRVILSLRVRGSVRAIRAVWNTQVFQAETRVVADNPPPPRQYRPPDSHISKI